MATTPKDYPIQLDTKIKIINESITLVQGDNLGNIFHFTLTENEEVIDLTGATITITMVKSDNTKLVNQCTLTNPTSGNCDYIVDIDALSALGQVVYTVEIYKNGGRTTTTQGKFKVISELDDGNLATSEGNYNVLSTLIEEVNTTENAIITNENIRKTNEDTRITNENDRIESENIRQSNETSRTNIFNTNESARQNTFNINETIRQANEDIRISNEENRVSEFEELKNASENSTNYATSRGTYANEQGDNAKSAATETRVATANFQNAIDTSKKIYKPSVDTYSKILTTYPLPQIGWTVQSKDTHIEYRWDGFTWIDIGVSDEFDGYNVYIGPTPPNNVNLLWVPSFEGQGRYARIIPSETEPIDKNQIWLKLS